MLGSILCALGFHNYQRIYWWVEDMKFSNDECTRCGNPRDRR